MTRVAPYLADAALVLLFAAIGRRSHAEQTAVLGVLTTAWPFLVGTALGWAIAAATTQGGPATLASGAIVVASTVTGGMLIRAAIGSGVAVSFVLVATTVLSVFLLGWRLLARWLG